MAKKNTKTAQMGKTKRSTDSIIDQAIARQNSWMENRRAFARRFLKKLNVFARPSIKTDVAAAKVSEPKVISKNTKNGIRAYWFPILCAILVIFIAVWVAFVRVASTPVSEQTVVVPVVPEPVVQVVAQDAAPSFDIVRIEKNGNVVIAGRWLPQHNVSIKLNKTVIATERTDSRGEFVYAPTKPFAPGNYTISLIGVETDAESVDNVFIYVSPHGYENSISLLMTQDGSTLLQSPRLVDGDLAVTKIDYLENGRLVVTGNALPRLRVSMTLNGQYLGYARVSDHKHFGLGADIEKLVPGNEYNLVIRLHDGRGKTVDEVTHTFKMPMPTGDDNTFYTVRRGDCLWIIARNFLRKGILFSIIAERNAIENPDLIFPKQILQIPVDNI